jgi:hypothetical protein
MKLCIAALFIAITATASAQELVLTNPLAADRSQEVVEVPLQQVAAHLHLSPAQYTSIAAWDATSHSS